FNAGTAVEAMEWDFTDFGGGSGVVPEPTTEIFNQFTERAKVFQERFRATTGKSMDDALTEEDVSRLDEQEIMSEMVNLLAFVCQDSPGVEQLSLLPPRVLMAFQGWLVGEISPESTAATTKR